jgi:rubrerythrin
LSTLIAQDLDAGYVTANRVAAGHKDRGALRALTWTEKVTRMQASLLRRFEQEQAAAFENTNVFVCEICGFIYVGETPPAICPVCKVPSFKIAPVERR